jgi:predicted transcriptional regulator
MDEKTGQGESTTISEPPKLYIPSMLASVLGMEETQILEYVQARPSDVQSIHLKTGLPLPSIEGKLRGLVHLGLVRILHDGRFVTY